MYEAIRIVRSMWEAECHGRFDDVLATMHPDVGCTPNTRPGLGLYFGHAGIRKMRDNMGRVLAGRQVVVDDISSRDDGSVLTRGHVMSKDDPGVPAVAFEVVCAVRDGLIVRFDSRDPGEHRDR
jgi:ketosteroid isomerase-like protein